MRRLIPCIDEHAALARFKRRHEGFWRRVVDRLLSRAPGAALARASLPRLDTIWLPYYLITFRAETKNGIEDIATSVDALSGSFALFALHDALAEGAPEAERFEAELSADKAISIARRSLLVAVMSQRGKRRRTVVKEVVSQELVYHPFYIYYFLRRGRYIDFGLLDAVVGDQPGPKMKAACLAAFEKAHDVRNPHAI